MEQLHVNKVSRQIFNKSKNCSVLCEHNLNVGLSWRLEGAFKSAH